jgi:hypothetical protein
MICLHDVRRTEGPSIGRAADQPLNLDRQVHPPVASVTIRGLARHPSPLLRVYRCGIADIIARARLRSATTLA